MYNQVWLTDAGRFIPRPDSISLTHASTVSHQVVASITTVACYISQCRSIGMTNLAIGSGIQSSTVYNCGMKESIYLYILYFVITVPCNIGVTARVLLHKG